MTDACGREYEFYGEAAELIDDPAEAEEDPEATESEAEVRCGQPSQILPAELGVRCLVDRCMTRRTHPNHELTPRNSCWLRPACAGRGKAAWCQVPGSVRCRVGAARAGARFVAFWAWEHHPAGRTRG